MPYDPDFTDLYAYSPQLWNDLIADVDPADPQSLVRFYDAARRIVSCHADVHQRLPELGLDLPKLIELRQAAWEDELAHAGRRWAGELRTHEALSPAMRRLIVNLILRGLPRQRVVCTLNINPAWVEHAMATAKLDDDDRAVVAAHLAGQRLAQIHRDTGVARTTIERIVAERLADKVRTNSHAASAARAAEARRLRAAGLTNADIATEMDLPLATVENYFKSARQPMRAAEPFQSGKRRQRRRGPAQ